MNRFSGAGILVLAALLMAAPVQAKQHHGRFFAEQGTADVRTLPDAPRFDEAQTAQADGDYAVSASEAASIARDSVPGSKVLKVELLPNGVYAVTLKDAGNVTRVMVDATTGELV